MLDKVVGLIGQNRELASVSLEEIHFSTTHWGEHLVILKCGNGFDLLHYDMECNAVKCNVQDGLSYGTISEFFEAF